MPVVGPKSQCLPRIRVFLNGNNGLKHFTPIRINHAREALAQPPWAGKKVDYGNLGKRLHEEQLDGIMEWQILEPVQD